MADWLKNPWIEKAIYSFYDKDANQPRRAKAQIIQFNKIPCEKSASAEALLSDKWMYVKAIFTPQAIEEFEKSRKSKECGLTLCDIKGGLVFLNEYKVVPHVDYAKGVWEHLLIVNKFSLKCSEKNSQFGSELINSAAHLPFQVRIKKHFQLKQLARLLQRPENMSRKLKLKDDKAFDVKAITNSFIERHQFVFIPDEQQHLLDNIPEWRSNSCLPLAVDTSNSLNASLPSNQQVQNDVSMSSNTLQSNGQNQPSTSGFNAEPSSNAGSLGLADKYEDDGTKIPDHLSPEKVQRSLHSTGVSCALEQHLELPRTSQVRTNLVQLLYRKKDVRKLKQKDNETFDVKAITNSFIERHQFVFIPDEQQQLLDNIPEWNNDFFPPTRDTSNSLNTSLPSNQQVQHDVSMSPKNHQLDDQNDDHQSSSITRFIAGSSDLHYRLKEPPPRAAMVGSSDSCERDGTHIRIPDSSSSLLEAVRTSPKSASVKYSLERHSDLRKSEQPCRPASSGGFLGTENNTKGKNRKEMEKRLRDIDMDIDESQSLNESSLMSERRHREEVTVHPPSSASATVLDILENLEHQSDPFVCNSRARKRNSVGDVVEENEEIHQWSQATSKDKLVRRSSIELALAKQMKKQDEWLGRCTQAEASFNESSLSFENLGSKEKAERGQECGARLQNDFQQGNSTTKACLTSDVSRFWLEFSQSQPLETRDLDDAGDECMADFSVGDQVDIVVEDATNDARKRFVKKVFSLGKQACHSLVTSVGSQAAKSFEDDKEGDQTTVIPLGQESREQSRNHHPQVDFSSRSVVVSGSGKFTSSFPGNIDDGYEETMRNETRIPGHTTWTTSRDEREKIKELGAHGSPLENTLNSQQASSRDESSALKEYNSFRQRDRFVRTSGDGDGKTLDSRLVSGDETRGGDAQVRTSQVQKQEQNENSRKRCDENMKDVDMEAYDESCSVAADVVQSLRRPEKKKERNGSRGTTASVLAGSVDQTNDQELKKKSRENYVCNVGELSTAGVADKQSCSCSEVSFLLNTSISGGSPSEQKSDESFSILKNTSILDLTPDGFKPAFTSTARQAAPSANQAQTLKAKETRKGLPRAKGDHTSTKKHVTFGKRTFYSNKYKFEASLYNDDPLDEDAIIPCTQQEEDSQLMTFQDPLQILKAMSPSLNKVSHEDPKSKILPCQATNNDNHNNGASRRDAMGFVDKNDATERSYKDYNSDATRGNALQKIDKRRPKEDAGRRQGHDRHAAQLASRSSDSTREQDLKNTQPLSDAPSDNHVNFQASSITGDDNEIVPCSDESEEFLYSPTPVMQCIKQSSSKVYDDIVLGSEDSAYAMTSSFSTTATNQNILQCIKQKANDDSRIDVTRSFSQSKQTCALPLRGPGIENTGRKSLQFSLSDSQLTRALIFPADKENLSLLRSKKRANSKERKSLQEGERAVSTSPSSIPTSMFYKTESNSNNDKPQEGELRSAGCDVNMMSHPLDTNEEAECLMFVPGKGLETSSVRVTLVSPEPAEIPCRNAEINEKRNNSTNKDYVSRRQTRTKLSKQKSNAKGEQEENQTMEKRRKLPQDFVSSTTPKVNLEDGLSILSKGARDVNKGVAMETEISSTSAMSSYEANFVRGEGRLKRKCSQEDENRAVKKLTTSAPSRSSAQGCLNIAKKKENNERLWNVCDSSQDLTQYSCEHMLYSQQDPLILEFSSSENSDQDFSQESKIRDLFSSPLLLPSPPLETKTASKSTEIGVSTSTCPETDMTEEQESCSPKFMSLPSYQVPTTKTNYLRHTNKQEDTTRGKTKPIIISDSEDDENENSFCWFSPR